MRWILLPALLAVLTTAADDPSVQDRTSIYRLFLKSYSQGSTAQIPLTRKLSPLRVSESERKGCLNGINLEMISTSDLVDSKILSGLNYFLDDRQPTLILSEIQFDSARRLAVMEFKYSCPLCGKGGKVVFEKVDGRWIASKRRCPHWIS